MKPGWDEGCVQLVSYTFHVSLEARLGEAQVTVNKSCRVNPLQLELRSDLGNSHPIMSAFLNSYGSTTSSFRLLRT